MSEHTTSGTAIIELVDSEILALGNDGQRVRDPGFALLGSGGIDTGETAFNQAWLYPQRSYNQFWHQLNLAPLPHGNRFARHYADLAYAQLSQLHQQMGKPAEILLAIPGSFSRDQLAILLGLANALSVKTLGLVDTAVAAASTLGDHEGELLHLDIQLHQAVITRIHVGNRITREAVELLPDVGLRHFYRGWAQYIANLFIREYRYDPLHTAEGEQQLFSKLPELLAQLSLTAETALSLSTPRGDFHLNLQRSALLESSLPRLSRLREMIIRLDVDGPLLASYRLGKLPGLARELGARVLDENQVINACRQAVDAIRGEGEGGVDFVTSLPRQGQARLELPRQGNASAPQSQPSTTPLCPTHVLYGHRAWVLASGIGIEVNDAGLSISRDTNAPLQIHSVDGRVWLRNNRYDLVVHGNRDNLRSGDMIRVAGHELRLIEVAAEG